MFTGIVTGQGVVREVTRAGGSHDMRAIVKAPHDFLAAQGGTAIGASIACSGCCLTVTALGPDWFAVDVSGESVARTTLGGWQTGTRINLERALRLGDEMGGHMVSGHVDGLGHVVAVTPEAGSLRLVIDVPQPLHRYIAPKGSVTVDGVSLTVNAVEGTQFGINVIPHTAGHTTLGLRAPGDAVHIEIDMLARYVARLRETADGGQTAEREAGP